VLFVRQKVRARLLAALGEHHLGDLFIGQVVQPVQPAPERGVGDRFDVEDQDVQTGP
jgi:hypothetical protein